MPEPPPDYEAIERDEWKKAESEVQEEAEKRTHRLLKRISTYIYRFGYDEDSVVRKIIQDHMFAAHFSKEPRRTGLHEAAAANWLKSLPNVNGFEVLNKSGPKSLKVSSDGNIESETAGKNLPGKSLDFRWSTGHRTCYAMHKYTKEGGGNQDSQFKEMLELMKRFTFCQDRQVVLLIIVDGNYYKENNHRQLNKLRRLESQGEPSSYAVGIEEVPDILASITKGTALVRAEIEKIIPLKLDDF